MAALLDDIRHEIVETRKLTESMIQAGVPEPLQPRTVTTERMLVTPPDPDKPWFGVKCWNDGEKSVFVIVNPRKTGLPQEIKPGGWWGVDFNTACITGILLYTENGETTVRISGER